MEKDTNEMTLEEKEKEQRLQEAFIEYNKTGQMNDIVREEMEKYTREDGDLNNRVIKKIIGFFAVLVGIFSLIFIVLAIKVQSKLLCMVGVLFLVYCIFSLIVVYAVLKKRRK